MLGEDCQAPLHERHSTAQSHRLAQWTVSLGAWLGRQSSEEVTGFWNGYLSGFKAPNSIASLKADESIADRSDVAGVVVPESEFPGEQIEQMEARLDKKMQRLINQYVAMELTLSQLQNQSDWLSS